MRSFRGTWILWTLALAAPLQMAWAAPVDHGIKNVRLCVGKSRRVLRLDTRADAQYTINGTQGAHSIFNIRGANGAARATGDVDTTEVTLGGIRPGTDTFSVEWSDNGTQHKVTFVANVIHCTPAVARLVEGVNILERAVDDARSDAGPAAKKDLVRERISNAIQKIKESLRTPGLSDAERERVTALQAALEALLAEIHSRPASELDFEDIARRLDRILSELNQILG